MNFFENCNYSCLWRSAFTQKHAFSNIWKYFRPSALTLWWPQVTSVSNKHCWGHSSMLWCLVAQAPPKSLFCRLEVSLSNNVWRYTCLKFELFSPKKCIWKPLGGQRVINPLSANPTKWSNTLTQFIDNCRQTVWVSLTILWYWRLKG